MSERPEIDRETQRHFIDKLDRAYAATAASETKLAVLQMILSLSLIALSFGVVSVKQNITVSGLTFSMPISTALLAGAALSTALSIGLWSTTANGSGLSDEIIRRYQALGLDVPPKRSMRSPYGGAGAVDNVTLELEGNVPSLLKVSHGIAVTAVVVLLLLVPTVAQAAAAVRYASASSGPWPWLSLLLPIVGLLDMVATLSSTPGFNENAGG